MNAKDAVVKRFWELCEKDNIKKNELARRAGISPSSVYSLFNDKRRDVSILTIKKLCDGLGISIKNFLILIFLQISNKKLNNFLRLTLACVYAGEYKIL